MSEAHYEITVEERLDRSHWCRWFTGMDVLLTDEGNTIISGKTVDQAALHGVLGKVRDLGLVLLSVQRADPGGRQQPVSEKE
jgi:hypothetical protein